MICMYGGIHCKYIYRTLLFYMDMRYTRFQTMRLMTEESCSISRQGWHSPQYPILYPWADLSSPPSNASVRHDVSFHPLHPPLSMCVFPQHSVRSRMWLKIVGVVRAALKPPRHPCQPLLVFLVVSSANFDHRSDPA